MAVDFVNRGGRRAHSQHVELNENEPYEFVGEDIILPYKMNENVFSHIIRMGAPPSAVLIK